jgi:hypothetical protein
MQFWFMVNRVLANRGLPDMKYGEAKSYWHEYEEKNWTDHIRQRGSVHDADFAITVNYPKED